MFIFPDAVNIFPNNVNVNQENFQMAEVKIESDEFNFAKKNTKIVAKNSIQDKVASDSK